MQHVRKNKKYHILLVLRWLGGIRTFCRYVYNEMDTSSYRFTILAPNTEGVNILVDDLKNFDVRTIRIKCDPSFANLNFRTVMKTIINGQFDLIHSHGFSASAYAAFPARLMRIPHIMTSHDVFMKDQFSNVKGRIIKILLNITFLMIDTIHCVSNDAMENFLEYMPTITLFKRKIVSIPHGIEIERFVNAKRRNLHKVLNLPKKTYLIGFLGRFMGQKGFRYLIDAMELLVANDKLPRKPLVLSFGSGGFIRKDKEIIMEKKLEQYFIFLPLVPNVAPTLKGLDVVVMPSLWEAYGLLAAEAMVAGVPLIGTDCIGLREVLKGTPSVVIPAKNSMALAEALEGEMKNPSRKKSEEFVPIAAKRFDVRNQAAELEKVFLDLIRK